MARYTTTAPPAAFRSTGTRRLSEVLDTAIVLPGGFRIGLDGIIGLVPGVGDAVAGVLSLLIIHQAYRHGVPKMVLLRMILNVAIDTAIGAIPILGDIFDFFWKANVKNARLLEDYISAPKKTYRRSALVSLLIMALVLVILATIAWLAWSLVALIWAGITN